MSRVDNLPFPQPLKADFTHPSSDVVDAYKTCFLAEQAIDMHTQAVTQHGLPWAAQDEIVRTKLVNIRVLGYLLSQSRFLSDVAVSEIARDVLSCQLGVSETDEIDVPELDELGEFYRDSLLRPFYKGRTPDTSQSPSSGSSSASESFSTGPCCPSVEEMLAESPKSHTTARNLAMQREDNRCIVTGILDREAAKHLHDQTGEVYTGVVVSLEVCHIFPDSTTGPNTAKRFARIATPRAAAVDQVHAIDNVVMMTYDLRYSFNRLSMWFEPVKDGCDRYRLCSVWTLPHGLAKGQEVTFHSTDPRLALPNREYLAIHAACCRVAHLSGASILFNYSEEDTDSDPDPVT